MIKTIAALTPFHSFFSSNCFYSFHIRFQVNSGFPLCSSLRSDFSHVIFFRQCLAHDSVRAHSLSFNVRTMTICVTIRQEKGSKSITFFKVRDKTYNVDKPQQLSLLWYIEQRRYWIWFFLSLMIMIRSEKLTSLHH